MKKNIFIIAILLIIISTINVNAKEGWIEEDGEKYYYENDEAISGWKEIDGNTYFFGITTHKLLHGWQYWNGKFYLDNEGKVTQGWNTIDGEKYYVKDNYMINQFQTIDGNTYFFGLTTYKLLHGWQYWNGKFYLDNEGKVTQGWNTIDGEKYYVKDNYMINQFQTIDGNTYFFGLTTYKLLHGWQNWNGRFYLDNEGKVTQGWNTIDGEKYYVKNNYMVNKFQTIDGETYFFGLTTYKLLHGWQYWNGLFYADTQSGKIPNGWFELDNKKYYSKDNYTLTGINEVDNKKYYFTNKGVLIDKTTITPYKSIEVGEDGELIKVQYLPTYYNQKDSRWTNIKYGSKKFGPTGCAPTSMAMAFTSIKERTILPTEIADYLYYQTNEYNKKDSGTSGQGIIKATQEYSVNIEPINSKEELISELSFGKIIFAAMGNGVFGTPRWNHAIIAYDYNEEKNQTKSLDPLNKNNNKWINIDTIWNEKSKDPDDTSGGSAIYSLSE